MSKLRLGFLSVLFTVACTPDLSSKGQMITCSTDPATGAVLSCAPGAGDPNDPNACQDVDEDGDGDPHDADDDSAHAADGSGSDGTVDDNDGDSDDDGISDDQDCDEHEGEDDGPSHS